MRGITDFGKCVTGFLTTYLNFERGYSQRTIASYSGAIKALVVYLGKSGIKTELIALTDITADNIRGFLDSLEVSGCGAATRNQRLAAIKSFVRYAMREFPEYMLDGQQVLAIPDKRCPVHEVEYLERDALKALLEAPDRTTAAGRREVACMALLYDSGARVQELIDLKVGDTRLDGAATVTLTGKGNKTRTVPITKETAALVMAHLIDRGISNLRTVSNIALLAPPGRSQYTRPGIAKMLNRNLERARFANPKAALPTRIHPHMLRATKAIHLLDAGINIILIRDLLGHVSVNTTQVYLRASTQSKRKAIEEACPDVIKTSTPNWREDGSLMSFLKEMSSS